MFECWDESGSEHPDIRIVPDAPSPFPSPQDTGLLDNQTLLCIYSQTVNRKAILEDQRFLKNIFPGREVSFIPQISGSVGGSRLRNFLPRN